MLAGRFNSEPPTLPKNRYARVARLLRLWATATEPHKRLLDEVAAALAPDLLPAAVEPLRHELRAARFARRWESSTPARQRLIEWLAWELTPDTPSEPPGPLGR